MARRWRIGYRLNVKLTRNWQRSQASIDSVVTAAAIHERPVWPPPKRGSMQWRIPRQIFSSACFTNGASRLSSTARRWHQRDHGCVAQTPRGDSLYLVLWRFTLPKRRRPAIPDNPDAPERTRVQRTARQQRTLGVYPWVSTFLQVLGLTYHSSITVCETIACKCMILKTERCWSGRSGTLGKRGSLRSGCRPGKLTIQMVASPATTTFPERLRTKKGPAPHWSRPFASYPFYATRTTGGRRGRSGADRGSESAARRPCRRGRRRDPGCGSRPGCS